jgi:hypothetical protein
MPGPARLGWRLFRPMVRLAEAAGSAEDAAGEKCLGDAKADRDDVPRAARVMGYVEGARPNELFLLKSGQQTRCVTAIGGAMYPFCRPGETTMKGQAPRCGPAKEASADPAVRGKSDLSNHARVNHAEIDGVMRRLQAIPLNPDRTHSSLRHCPLMSNSSGMAGLKAPAVRERLVQPVSRSGRHGFEYR